MRTDKRHGHDDGRHPRRGGCAVTRTRQRERDEAARIRDLFLNPRKDYPPAEAARITDTNLAELMENIEKGRLDAEKFYLLARREVLRLALERWPFEVIVRALGAQAKNILPRQLQLEELRVVLPGYILRVLEYEATRTDTTTSEVLRRLLQDYATSLRDSSMDDAIPGLGEALFYPDEP